MYDIMQGISWYKQNNYTNIDTVTSENTIDEIIITSYAKSFLSSLSVESRTADVRKYV